MTDVIFNSSAVKYLAQTHYSLPEIEGLEAFLLEKGLFDFEIYPNTGLFPATHMCDEVSNYNSVWLRDTIHIANALFSSGMIDVAETAMDSLVNFHIAHIDRWHAVVNDPALAEDPMNRPHVRFDGERLVEVDEKWSHAQNDAIGYFLWMLVKVVKADQSLLKPNYLTMLQVIPIYLNSIEFWKDADSGHWEEEQKVEASSIGCCVAGLEALVELCKENDEIVDAELLQLIESMIPKGRKALDKILPNESLPTDSHKGREVDGALLFLCYPLRVVSDQQSKQIRDNVVKHLQGDYGIRRYLGDSFWTRNYPDLMDENDRTRDFSNDISARDQLAKAGDEAQWCIFDSILSVCYGLDYLLSDDLADKKKQTYYFNRSIGQITGEDSKFGEFMMPEAYYLQDDKYIPNDATPLQWAKANLIHAFRVMRQTHEQ